VFFVITDLIDNQVLFRESAASLCIEAILRMPFEQVESIMAELGLGHNCDRVRMMPLLSNSANSRTRQVPINVPGCSPEGWARRQH
jgi:hypothetical protein